MHRPILEVLCIAYLAALALLHRGWSTTALDMSPQLDPIWLLCVFTITVVSMTLRRPKLDAWKNVAAISVLLAATIRSFPIVCFHCQPPGAYFPFEGATGLFALLILRSKST